MAGRTLVAPDLPRGPHASLLAWGGSQRLTRIVTLDTLRGRGDPATPRGASMNGPIEGQEAFDLASGASWRRLLRRSDRSPPDDRSMKWTRSGDRGGDRRAFGPGNRRIGFGPFGGGTSGFTRHPSPKGQLQLVLLPLGRHPGVPTPACWRGVARDPSSYSPLPTFRPLASYLPAYYALC